MRSSSYTTQNTFFNNPTNFPFWRATKEQKNSVFLTVAIAFGLVQFLKDYWINFLWYPEINKVMVISWSRSKRWCCMSCKSVKHACGGWEKTACRTTWTLFVPSDYNFSLANYKFPKIYSLLVPLNNHKRLQKEERRANRLDVLF